jgi:hypothetical protein
MARSSSADLGLKHTVIYRELRASRIVCTRHRGDPEKRGNAKSPRSQGAADKPRRHEGREEKDRAKARKKFFVFFVSFVSSW